MSASLDAIGNCVGRYEAATAGAPCLMLGSHLDTVRDAGRYDGMLGVVTAIECVAALSAAGTRLPFAIVVVGFGDEEGVRFGSTLLGSRAIAGTFDTRAARPAGPRRRAAARRAARVRPRSRAHRRRRVRRARRARLRRAPHRAGTGARGGGAAGRRRHGDQRRLPLQRGDRRAWPGHAGTVPMALRRDALAAAAECVLAVEPIAAGRARRGRHRRPHRGAARAR